MLAPTMTIPLYAAVVAAATAVAVALATSVAAADTDVWVAETEVAVAADAEALAVFVASLATLEAVTFWFARDVSLAYSCAFAVLIRN